jgi:hypothetical protein
MEQAPKVGDPGQEEVSVHAIQKVFPLRPGISAVWDPVEAAAGARVKDKAVVRAATDGLHINLK